MAKRSDSFRRNERLERLLIESELPDWDAATMHYALASLCERLDQTGRAFDPLSSGASASSATPKKRRIKVEISKTCFTRTSVVLIITGKNF